MNADRLLAHYATITEAPGAIARLRHFILDLAIRGKLVPQDSNDEPASNILKRFELARVERSNVTGDARIPKSVDRLHKHRFPIKIPECWDVASFDSLFLFVDYRGRTPSKTAAGVPLITAKNVRMGYVNREPREYVSEETYRNWMTRGLPSKGDLFFTTEAPLANVCINDLDEGFALAQRVICMKPYAEIQTKFLMFAIMSSPMQSLIDSHATGLTAKGIKAARLKPLLLPVPPLAEQVRIAQKVDQLMALCDQLETARKEREESRRRLTTASFARLDSPELVAGDARFVLDSLPALTARSGQMRILRQTILNMAVRGALVPQNPDDEPAPKQFEKEGRLEDEQADVSVAVENGLYGLPESWRWVRLGSLVERSDAGWSPKTEDFPRAGDKWGVLKVSAVSWGKFRPWENKQILDESEPRLQAKVNRGDFLISRANTIELIARAVIVEEQPQNLMMSDKIVRLWFSDRCDKRYILLVNNYADFAREYYRRQASGASPSMKNITRDAMLGLPCPLAPLAEQSRIVAKVDQLMLICDQLEKNLTVADETRNRLLNLLLAEALQESSDAIAA